ncbi:MAG TPA: hypothetical protein VFQ72_03190 [Candidatus Paceibacterota bacterium]|nr:hypothetical protein [Candidatus Paceibacterota bacterium]
MNNEYELSDERLLKELTEAVFNQGVLVAGSPANKIRLRQVTSNVAYLTGIVLARLQKIEVPSHINAGDRVMADRCAHIVEGKHPKTDTAYFVRRVWFSPSDEIWKLELVEAATYQRIQHAAEHPMLFPLSWFKVVKERPLAA